jgi:hypothetical protein
MSRLSKRCADWWAFLLELALIPRRWLACKSGFHARYDGVGWCMLCGAPGIPCDRCWHDWHEHDGDDGECGGFIPPPIGDACRCPGWVSRPTEGSQP